MVLFLAFPPSFLLVLLSSSAPLSLTSVSPPLSLAMPSVARLFVYFGWTWLSTRCRISTTSLSDSSRSSSFLLPNLSPKSAKRHSDHRKWVCHCSSISPSIRRFHSLILILLPYAASSFPFSFFVRIPSPRVRCPPHPRPKVSQLSAHPSLNSATISVLQQRSHSSFICLSRLASVGMSRILKDR